MATTAKPTPLDYVSQMSKVEGWLHTTSAAATVAVARVADRHGVTGGSAEIGVHHGRFFILLNLLAAPSAAIDVFERQDLNVDQSGRGDQEVFMANCRRFGLDPEQITVIADSSANVTVEQIMAATGPVRLFSVDGGHTAAITEKDLRLATSCLTDGGVVILDDYFNPEWPDVSIGANRFLAAGPLEPFAIAPNKLFFTNNSEIGDRYRAVLQTGDSYFTTQEMAGADVVVLASHWKRRLAARLQRAGVVDAVASSALGAPLARMARNLLSN